MRRGRAALFNGGDVALLSSGCVRLRTLHRALPISTTWVTTGEKSDATNQKRKRTLAIPDGRGLDVGAGLQRCAGRVVSSNSSNSSNSANSANSAKSSAHSGAATYAPRIVRARLGSPA